MKIGKPRGDIPTIHGVFEGSTEILDIVSYFSVIASQMDCSIEDLKVGSRTLFFIHPLWLFRFARVADYGELHNPASGRREWTNPGNLLAEFLSARHPCTLRIDLVPSTTRKREWSP